jgi:hypothetical protein
MRSSGAGKIGKNYDERKLANDLRNLTIAECTKIMKKGNTKENELFAPLLIKLAGNILPRLNEHSGADGKELPPLEVRFINAKDNN